MENNRKKDMAVEREIAAFLDEHLYSNKEIFTEFARTDGYDEQIAQHDQREGIRLFFRLEDVLGSRIRESLVLGT